MLRQAWMAAAGSVNKHNQLKCDQAQQFHPRILKSGSQQPWVTVGWVGGAVGWRGREGVSVGAALVCLGCAALSCCVMAQVWPWCRAAAQFCTHVK